MNRLRSGGTADESAEGGEAPRAPAPDTKVSAAVAAESMHTSRRLKISLFIAPLVRGCHRREKQGLVVETEVRQGRYGFHGEMVYGSVRFQRECQECILHGPVAPMRLECIVLP